MEKLGECHVEELESMSEPISSLESIIFDIRSLILRFFRYGEFCSLITYMLSIGPLRILQMDKRATRKSDMKTSTSKPVILNLQPGEIVEVLSEAEILSTLDSTGKYHGLGFMPEMRKFCGKRFRVLKRVDRMMIEGKGMRKLRPTVILEGVFCDGEAHGGCQRTCYCFWREGWLRRVKR